MKTLLLSINDKFNRSIILLLSLFFISALIISCGDDDDNTPPEPTVFELVSSGRWYSESQTNQTLDDCKKQSNYRFLENGNFISEVYTDNSGSCEISNTTTGTWELVSDTQLKVGPGVWTIITISDTELVLSIDTGSEVVTVVLDKNPGDG